MNIPRILVISALLHCLVAASGAQVSVPQQPTLHNMDVPIGSLGFPVGSYLTIEGVRLDGAKSGGRTLRVDTVNGQKLVRAVAISVEKTEALPKSKRCVLKGYETFRMIGQPPAYDAAAMEAGGHGTLPQVGWQLHFFFVTMSVVSPGGLKLEKGP